MANDKSKNPFLIESSKRDDMWNNERDQRSETMAASYTEIAFGSRYSEFKDETANGNDIAHTSRSQTESDGATQMDFDSDEDLERTKGSHEGPQRPDSLVCDKSFPYNLEGTVCKDGAITHFVAENLEYKIKIASPITKRDPDHPSTSSRNSTPSTSGLIPRHFLLPQQLAQLDSNVLNDIEIEAQYLAASVDNLTENLCNLLHSISSITADNVEIHKNTVSKLTDSMDANIKCMYTIMAKTEEISKSMLPTEQIGQRIREIKRLVDMLESNL